MKRLLAFALAILIVLTSDIALQTYATAPPAEPTIIPAPFMSIDDGGFIGYAGDFRDEGIPSAHMVFGLVPQTGVRSLAPEFAMLAISILFSASLWVFVIRKRVALKKLTLGTSCHHDLANKSREDVIAK